MEIEVWLIIIWLIENTFFNEKLSLISITKMSVFTLGIFSIYGIEHNNLCKTLNV